MTSKPNHRSWVLTSLGAAGIGLLVFACSSGNGNTSLSGHDAPGSGSDGGASAASGSESNDLIVSDAGKPNTYQFEAVGPSTYVVKVKNLMTGLAATDEEVAAVKNDPTQLTTQTALRSLIDGWMATPQFQGKMIEFFRNAWQQNQVQLSVLQTNTNFPLQNMGIKGSYQARFAQSLEDSFPMTVWSYVGGSSPQPLNTAITTDTYMLTTAQLALLSYMDELQVADSGNTTNRLVARHALTKFTLDPQSTATISQILDPTDSAHYMHWPFKVQIPTMNVPSTCTVGSLPAVTYDSTPSDAGSTPTSNEGNNYQTLFTFLMGGGIPYLPCYPVDMYGNTPSVEPATPTFSDGDFSDWRMVKIVPIKMTDDTSPVFWDIASLRAAQTVNLHVTRVGFSGTLAYEANWGTNVTNENRVTANQSLIVSIGQSIDDDGTLALFPVNATDADHAANPACSGCHNQLDPMKQYFRQSYSLFYKDQGADMSQNATQAGFAVTTTPQGPSAQGQYLPSLMTTLSAHPRFPLAWTQKLQFWANSLGADETDPEMLRIASVFAASTFDFKTLAKEVFSSPLVTFAASTQTTQENGVLNSISRRDHYCAALSNRLGVPDLCGQTTTSPNQAQQTISSRASLLAVDTYYRAFALPSLPTNPDLFFRATVENICGTIAGEVVDDNTDAGASRYASTNPTAAITDMVNNVMGIPPSDPRNGPATKILTAHLASAKQVGGSAADALKSTFILACSSPSAALIGL